MRLSPKLQSFILFALLFALPLGLIIKTANSDPEPANSPASVAGAAGELGTRPANPGNSRDAAPSQPPASDPSGTSATSVKLLIGEPTAPVTLIKYSDFQCPFCAQFFRQTEPSLLAEYVDTSKVKIEYRVETHLGRESIRSGEASYCANDQGSFRQYHDALFRRQRGINVGTFNDDNLKRIAAELKLDTKKFNDCLDGQKYRTAVEESHAEAQRRGINQTPTIYIGDRKIAGAQPYSIYKALIDEQL